MAAKAEGARRRRFPGALARVPRALTAGLAVATLLAACGGAASAPAGSSGSSAKSGSTAKHASANRTGPAPGSAPKAALTAVTLSVPTTGLSSTFVFNVARDMGFFAKNGLKVQFVTGSPTTAALVLAQHKYDFMGTVGTVIRAAEAHQPERVVLECSNAVPLVLVGRPGIHSISQLRGKAIALVQPSDSFNVITEALLKHYGLQPSDYRVLNAGAHPSGRVALLTQGKVAATVLDPLAVLPLLKQGYTRLATTIGTVPFPGTGLGTSLWEMQHRPDVVRRMITATLQGVHAVAGDEAGVVPLMAHDYHMSTATAKTLFQEFKPGWTLSGRPSAAAVNDEFTSDMVAMQLKSRPKTADIFDLSFLPKAAAS